MSLHALFADDIPEPLQPPDPVLPIQIARPNSITLMSEITELRRQVREGKEREAKYHEYMINHAESMSTLKHHLTILSNRIDDHNKQDQKTMKHRERRHTKHVDLSDMPMSALALLDSMGLSLNKYQQLTRLFTNIPSLKSITKARNDLNKVIESEIKFNVCPDGTGGSWVDPSDVARLILKRHPLPDGCNELRLLFQLDGAKVSRSQNMVSTASHQHEHTPY
jgi:Zn-finger nucleic acid-binding protein